MANYSITINSKFKPFSYSEMLAPVKAMTDEHQKIEEQMALLNTEASKLEEKAKESKEPYAYNLYKRFAGELALAADDLARNGLTASSRQSLYNMKARYNSEIQPIVDAYNRRAADIKRQQDITDKTGERTLFTRRAGDISLDEYLNNETPDWSQTNLDTIRDEGIAAGKSFSSRYFDTDEGKLFKGAYLNFKQINGLNAKQRMDALSRSGKFPEFDNFINNELQKVGASNYSAEDRASIESALMQGLDMGIVYKEDNKPVENWVMKSAMDHASRMQAARVAAAGPQVPPRRPGLPGATVKLRSKEAEQAAGATMRRNMSEIAWNTVVNYAQQGNKDAKNILSYWGKKGGKDAAIEKWSTTGFDGGTLARGRSKDIGKNSPYGTLYYHIGNAFRSSGITNENMINEWRRPLRRPRSSSVEESRKTVIAPDPLTISGSFRKEASMNPPEEHSKSWSNFDEESSKVFSIQGVSLPMSPSDIGTVLDRVLKYNAVEGSKVRLFPLKGIKKDGTMDYGNTYTKLDELPRTSTGEFDLSKCSIILLPGNDLLLQWWKDSKLVERVLKLKDIGEEGNAIIQRSLENKALAEQLYGDDPESLNAAYKINEQSDIGHVVSLFGGNMGVETFKLNQ